MSTAVQNVVNTAQYPGPDGKGWICDRCGEVIEKAGDGWVQWIIVGTRESGDRKIRDMSLVHHFPASPLKETDHRCQFDESLEFRKDGGIVGDLGLDSLCGNADGLMHLLSLLAMPGANQGEVLEIVKRTQIAGYERARLYVDRAIAEGVIEPNLPQGFYWQSNIRAVLEWAENN